MNRLRRPNTGSSGGFCPCWLHDHQVSCRGTIKRFLEKLMLLRTIPWLLCLWKVFCLSPFQCVVHLSTDDRHQALSHLPSIDTDGDDWSQWHKNAEYLRDGGVKRLFETLWALLDFGPLSVCLSVCLSNAVLSRLDLSLVFRSLFPVVTSSSFLALYSSPLYVMPISGGRLRRRGGFLFSAWP